MLIISIIALTFLFIMGAIMFIDCKVVEDLPENNEFRKWWKKHLIDAGPKD